MSDIDLIKSKIDVVDFVDAVRTQKFEDALDIVRSNSLGGKIWAVGGSVFRKVVARMYERPSADKHDFDFIVENIIPFEDIKIPVGWELMKAGPGGHRLQKGEKQIDFWSLDSAINCKDNAQLDQMTCEEKLESYFSRVMLTVQAIAYDIDAGRLVGDVGIKAIQDQLIEVNCQDECLSFCKRRKISVKEFMTQKATSLGFKIVPPDFGNFFKEVTTDAYDQYAQAYDEETVDFWKKFPRTFFDKFISLQKQGAKVLDVGSGPGRDGLILQEGGLDVICLDVSKAMMKLCEERGLKTIQADFDQIPFENNFFDGVWAYTSLLHVPKLEVELVLKEVYRVLKLNGILGLGLIEGKGEEYRKSPKVPMPRLFVYYTQQEVEKLLSDNGFRLIHFEKFQPRKSYYLNFIAQKNV